MSNNKMLMSLLCFALAACAPEQAPEFCRNHALFHAEHLDTLVSLNVTMTEDGIIRSELSIPISVMAGMPSELLEDSRKVYSLQTENECVGSVGTIDETGNSVAASYESNCGVDNKIGQLDILLFELVPALDEVEVTVTTPVTQKHFAINRQCDSAIFKLE
jgi:hypothetical protein